MKKIYSLFILSILALTMFVGCQMPTDGTDSKLEAEETEYTITIVAPHGTVELDKTKAKAGETVRLTKLKADKDYTLKTMSIKKENGEDVAELDRKNQSFTMPNCNVTVTVNFEKMYSLSVNKTNNPEYVITGGGMKEADKTVTLSITHYDVNKNDWVTPKEKELYLVKVHIKEGETELTDITVTVTKDHKITFTMPEKNINVFAEFYDIKCSPESVNECNTRIKNESNNKVMVVLCFNCKAYDNLEEVAGKYIIKVSELENGGSIYLTETKYGDYELIKNGTLDDKQYKFGVIDNGTLTILNTSRTHFTYKPNAGLQSK